ncbi:type II toxin-antitoxin system RelE/ParE family toxin [Agrococcus baldri]|uniref:type II toxin-antitoxin system RelE/ParE family toxin n=1 Tax=Agrococcus baldri TaxID=153730 RepID=UPI00296F6474|nr:type II toxin-antitoxin system RelE/ParE family toxin [Agrococcus baldri]
MSLDDRSYDQVIGALEVLAEHGPQLGRPLVDSIAGSRHRNMKELRPGSSGRSELRLLFASTRNGMRSSLSVATRLAIETVGTPSTCRLPTHDSMLTWND